MKKSAKTRIIVWSIVSVVLTATLILSAVFMPKTNVGDIISGVFDYMNDDYDENFDNHVFTGSLDQEFDPAQVKDIEVNWAAGKIVFAKSDSDKIKVYEKTSGELKDRDKMQCIVKDDGTLEINCTKGGRVFFGLNFSSVLKKSLTVELPQNCNLSDIEINCASANIEASQIQAEALKVNTASSNVNITDCTLEDIKLDGASGKIELNSDITGDVKVNSVSGKVIVNGNCKSIDLTSVSGKVEFNGTKLNKANVETVSGDVELNLPQDISGFTAEFKSTSGDFESDFETTRQNKNYNYKDGSIEIDVQTVSGSLKINKSISN